MSSCDVVIVGAGPYGLAATATLRDRGASSVRLFGEPMSSWAAMPVGMLLRSPYDATHITGRRSPLSLNAFHASRGTEPAHPVPLDTFVSYGRWFADRVAPDVDARPVARIARNNGGFEVSLADGEQLEARRVVVAAGITTFAWRPPVFRDLPSTHVSHTAEHTDLGVFRGKSVLVIGGGQSALESAALLNESGATAEVAVRNDVVHWLARRWQHRLGPVTRMLYAPPDVGPAGVSWLVALPDAFRRLPRETQSRFSTRSLRPAGAGWLVPRFARIPIHLGCDATGVELTGDGQVEVTFRDGSVRRADHVLLGTGYRADINAYPFFADDLLAAIGTVDGYPVLDRGFQTSVPGLHVLGAPAAWSFGPLMRFVAGAGFAAGRLTRGIRGR